VQSQRGERDEHEVLRRKLQNKGEGKLRAQVVGTMGSEMEGTCEGGFKGRSGQCVLIKVQPQCRSHVSKHTEAC
jgi:hypothetical protein